MTSQGKPIRIVPLIHAGARRGARALAPYLATWNRQATFSLSPVYVDPVPGRADAMRERASELGLAALAEESAIEDYLTGNKEHDPRSVLLLSLDNPRSISQALDASTGIPVLAYSIWQFPTGHLAGFQAAIAPDDEATRRRLAGFFRAVDTLTARAGSGAVFGERANGANHATEPFYRNGFGAHLARSLPKLASRLEPDDPPIGLVLGGGPPEAATIVESPRQWRREDDLLGEAPKNPIAPGSSQLILELGPDGLRVHRLRLRRVDRGVTLTTITGTEPRGPARFHRGVPSPSSDPRTLAALGLTLGALLLTD